MCQFDQANGFAVATPSGAVNKGRQLEVLARQLDALDPAESALDGIAEDRGVGHQPVDHRVWRPDSRTRVDILPASASVSALPSG
jgi:hypothetical protein